ncbi:MAG: hypothetical protein ACSHYB_00760 [Roseibacillus sp.]
MALKSASGVHILFFMSGKILGFLSLALVLFLSSCEDKKMVAQHKEQSREILILREELNSLKVRIDDKPTRDPSAQLESQETLVEEKKGALSDLEKELQQLKVERKDAEKSFSDYKLKYRLGE